MTPLDLEILLHYHSRVADHPELVNIDKAPPAYRAALTRLLAHDYLRHTSMNASSHYASTDKLHVYVEALCNVPEPVRSWTMPND